jgi:AcrR family transcriptional regulator
MTAELETGATHERILDAAERCLRQLGLHRVSMGDVATQAGVSRGSVYRYFPDRRALLDAVLERSADRFVAGSTASVDRRRTLAAQVGEAAVFILEHRRDDTLLTGEESLLATLLSVRVHGLLERWVEFWLPRLADAAARGEVRSDLDPRQAAEWIVRLMLSFAVMPSVTVDLGNPDAVRTFVRNHLVQGLAPREAS